jgi:cobalamin biosynthesis protein CobD/CbiB
MKFFTFILINFIVSVFSDIILNDMANGYKPGFLNSRIINSLKPYFANKSIIISAIYAGLTICVTLILLSFITKILFEFYIPKNIRELSKYVVLGFILGYVVDILIDKLDITTNNIIRGENKCTNGYHRNKIK